MEAITAMFTYLIYAIQGIAGLYATFKLSVYGIAYMRKNTQKVEEAKEGLKNVVIGLAICLAGFPITDWLKSGFTF